MPRNPCRILLLSLAALAAAVNTSAGETRGPLEEIRATGLSGVCVQVGCGDGTRTAELAQSGNLLVHALEADEVLVAKARAALSARGLYGQAAVEHWTSPSLPYANELVNVLVAEKPGSIGEKEILRVLAPNGAAWVRRDGEWKVLRKPWPKEYDEWTHRRHGPGGSMTSEDLAVSVPTGIRWVAGPAQNAGGKQWYYDHLMVTSAGRSFYVFDNEITARDAFNGRLLWSVKVKTPTFKEVSVGGPRTSKVCPVAGGDKLFCIAEGKLTALNAATGAHALDYGPVEAPREILLAEGVLLVSDKTALRAFSRDAKPLWTYPAEVKRMVAGDGRVFCVAGSRVACLELKTGKERWGVEEPKAAAAETCSYGCGVLVLERSTWKDDGTGGGVAVLSGGDGKALWAKDYLTGMTHYHEPRAFFTRDLLWLQLERGKVGGFDPQTGKPEKEWTSCGGHCAPPIATTRYLIAPEVEFTDWENGKRTRARMLRSACRNPFVPANGLLYTFPVQCECFAMLRGYFALEHEAPLPADESARLEKGPAYGRSTAAPKSDAADEWPMYRHDAVRSGSTPAKVNAAKLAPAWQMQLAPQREGLLAADWKDNPYTRGPITPPVAAGGVVLAAVPDEHLVVALDARTGARRWSFTAGGRVDTPPTVSEGLCVFGAHDGCVYGVAAADGALAWRFRAAPQERRIMAYGQMESPWPVIGSVLVDGGVAYFAAGRHPASDGGVHVFALQVRTAQVLWRKTVTDIGMKSWYGPMLPPPRNKIKVGVDYEPVDLLMRDGEFVAMSRWRFNRETGEFALDTANLEYEPFPGLAVPRGLWSYGIRQTKMVDPRPPAVFDRQKVYVGTPQDRALLLAGEGLITATNDGKLKAGEQGVELPAPAVHDGLIAAYGCLYVSTADGKVVCLGAP